jgi:aminoglycoside phosphotransferase (APT) family kinase protein
MVLRLYAADTDPIQPRLEQAIQDGLADAHFSAPRVIIAECDSDQFGGMFVVMERLPGRGFLRGVRWDQFVADFPKVCIRWPGVLVEVAERLHQVDPAPVLAAAAKSGIEASKLMAHRHIEVVAANLGAFGDRRTDEALAWMTENEPAQLDAPSIIHGDLWPANVLMRRGRLTGLVDWTMAGIGDPALDLGFACAGLALMPAPLPPPSPIRQGIHAAGKNLAQRVREQYLNRVQMTAQRIEFYEALRCLVELSAVLSYRHRSNSDGAGSRKPPWDKGVNALVGHFMNITGVPIAID